MKSARRLLVEAVLAPLAMWVIMWSLGYIRPFGDVGRENFNASWLITTIVSFFITLALVILFVKRLLRKAGYSQVGLRELPRVLDEADPKIIGGSMREIFTIVALWGAFSTWVLELGPKKGIIFTVSFAVIFVVVALPLMVSMLIPIMEVPFLLYEILTGKRLSYIFKEILLVSLVSGGFLIFLSLIATHLGASEIVIIRPLLKFYMNRDLYKNLLLLSALNALYGLIGIFILPRRRRLGLLTLLLIALALVLILIKVFIQLHSL
ncbi:hypothetical protein E3E36_06220 [Thermococcus sp. M36]|uniref:hypothetical protein n=1 Tax=Thermococcus sp. M36 TaxID=1638261 RepID=UPI0014394ABA|nr:hypothetical protein [Thermococcus sp. M36]NJE05743.1 hypothetical protein [Thermococcus sp. M36]